MPKWKTPKLQVTRFCNNRSKTFFVPFVFNAKKTIQEENTPSEECASACHDNEDNDPSVNVIKSKYQYAKQRQIEKWAYVRADLFEAGISSYIPDSFTCVICETDCEEIQKCSDCGTQFLACESCMRKEHVHRPLHNIKRWHNGRFHTDEKVTRVLKSGICSCQKLPYSISVVSSTGYVYEAILFTCDCKSVAAVLTSLQIWPASPEKPRLGFEFSFLELYDVLLLEGHLSAKAYIMAYAHKNKLDQTTALHIYQSLMSECLEEFKQFRRKKEELLSPSKKYCWACPETNAIITMDANFGLVHKKSSGNVYDEPKHPWKVFIPDSQVQTYLNGQPDGRTKNNQPSDCNSFQAGDKLRSKIKNKKLDVTGIFAAICRHEIPFVIFNMSEGERLAYPKLAMETILKEQNCAKFMYDIACVLKKTLSKTEDGKMILSKSSLAIPQFHVYGHQTKCQVEYSPTRSKGYGLTDGEGTERLWSYLRPFCKITKEMTLTHRQDLITDAVQYYSMRKKSQMINYLLQRHRLAEKTIQSCNEEKLNLLQNYNVHVTTESIKEWQEEEKELLLASSKKTGPQLRWEENYVSLLIKWETVKGQMLLENGDEDVAASYVVQEKELNEKLSKIERKEEIARWKTTDKEYDEAKETLVMKKCHHIKEKMLVHARERKFLCSLIKKYCDGQGIAKKLSKQISSCTKKIKKLVVLYNEWCKDKPVALNMALTCESEFYALQTDIMGEIPASVKKQSLDLHYRHERANEELTLLEDEMQSFARSVKSTHDQLSSQLVELSSSKCAIVREALQELEILFLKCAQFPSSIEDVVLTFVETDMAFMLNANNQTECDDCDLDMFNQSLSDESDSDIDSGVFSMFSM